MALCSIPDVKAQNSSNFVSYQQKSIFFKLKFELFEIFKEMSDLFLIVLNVVLGELEALAEVLDEGVHLGVVDEGQEGDDAGQSTENVGRGRRLAAGHLRRHLQQKVEVFLRSERRGEGGVVFNALHRGLAQDGL